AIGFDGRMTDLVPEYAGLTAAEARERVRNDLFAQGLLGDEHDYEHEVGHCDRSGDRIEPLISLQWFMQMQELAAPANAAVRSGAVRFVPRSRERIYFDFMDNIRPWCVSRQLWWGHQIPVWYCPDGHSTCAVIEPDSCSECGSSQLERDPDVLDTWFSSALWPFATLGWPEQTERLAAFYPSNVLVTDRGIINLWVARMMMMGIEFMGEIPFPDVFIHSTIQAPDGRRMSKSLGTGINPLDLVERYGADGTRYGLLKMSSTQDVRFAEGMIDEGAKLANKLWNASRFVLLQSDTTVAPAAGDTTLEDRWMLSRLEGASEEVLHLIDEYDFAGAVKALYSLIWNDFCDWYVEVTKSRLYGDDQEARRDVSATLLWVLERILAVAHPVLPFVTEEIWSFMPGERDLLMASPLPEPQPQRRDAGLEEAAGHDMEVVSVARRIANEGETPSVVVRSDTLFRSLLPKSAAVSVDDAAPAASAVASADAAQLQSKLDEALAELERARAKLANQRFTERAPAELVEAEREKARRFEAEVADLKQRLADL
ncbi:MAG: valyl-tRNA synthetase, partial [Gaiellales bacterium]|nr:valyl-tRNA synthetase [Gaiellales bacterium]